MLFNCILLSEYFSVAENVLGKAKHRHENQQLSVCVFRDELGYAPGGYTNRLAKIPIPDDMIIHGIDSSKIEFLKTVKTSITISCT